ncbi:MAG: low molecular weight phosphotyrosine protein phosphatase [Muribaculaceae bacterium]|nr:low molecular weight phosphotyrosine protein phosphatase [Muribaculaceae bacterium]
MVNHKVNHKTIELINSLKSKEKIRVLFVCLGNICRSPAAEGVMKAVIDANNADDRFVVDSAGTGNYHVGDLPDRRMRVHGARRGYTFDHICRQVRSSDFDEFDIILPMDASNERNLHAMAPNPECERKIVPMAEFIDLASRYDHVPDPYYEGAEGFELVLDLLENGCRNLYNELRAHPPIYVKNREVNG